MSEILTIDTESGLNNTVNDNDLDILPVYGDEHPMLSQKIPEYTGSFPNGALTVLVKRLKLTMKMYNGVGLSSNQCGVFERVFVMRHEGNVLTCINPRIVDESDEVQKMQEGCLSFPGMFLTIPRSKWITVQWTDENGDVYDGRMEGLPAVIFQHELNHLNGVKMTDLVKPLALRMAKEKQMKFIKKIKRQMKKN